MRLRKFLYNGAVALFFASIIASPAKVVLRGLAELNNDPSKHLEPISGAQITIFDKRAKHIIKLSTKKNFDIGTKSVFLQGTFTKTGTTLGAATDIVNGKVRVSFPGKPHGSRKSRQRLYTLIVNTKDGEAVGRLSSIPSSVLKGKTCGAEEGTPHTESIARPLNEGVPANQALVATLHTYADPEFVDVHGAATDDEIATIVNEAEAIYSRQLGIRFRLVGRTKLTERTPDVEPGNILASFLNNPITKNNNVDLKHMFTGKDMEGTTIGLAFVSAVCWEPSYAYGITQTYGFYTSYIFAHEIGHNFGAQHDTVNRGTLMYPYISPGSEFSQTSINQISSHVMTHGSCLDVEPIGPDLTKAKLSIGRINRLIVGRLIDDTGAPIANEPVTLYVNGVAKVLKTDARGVFRTVIKSKQRRFVVFVTTKKGESRSRVLKFRV